MHGVNEVLFSSFFGNGYVTYLDAEITDYIFRKRKVPRQEFLDVLHERGYGTKDVLEELNRQCYASTIRYIPSEDVYLGLEIGRNLWIDILHRMHDQESIVGGKIEGRDLLRLDIYRSDFQSLKFKRIVQHLGLHKAPVMRWMVDCRKEDALRHLDLLISAVPCTVEHEEGNLSVLLQRISEANNHKPRRTTWAWIVTHTFMQLELTPSQKLVLKTVIALSKGPVDWKGRLISFEELQKSTNLPPETVHASIEYLEAQGIVREVNQGLTPTGEGYILVRYALKSQPSVTFAVTHESEKEYLLEICTPRLSDPTVQDSIRHHGGKVQEPGAAVTFSPREKSEVLHLVDAVGCGLI